jgi:DNA recombination protein RmuC
MLNVLLVCQIVTFIAVIVLLLRRQQAPAQDQLTRLDTRSQALDENVRSGFSQMRNDIAAEAQRSREASAGDFSILRKEVTGIIDTLGQTLQRSLADFRNDNKVSDNQLRSAVQQQLDAVANRLTSFTNDTNEGHTNLREGLNSKLNELMTAVEDRLNQINKDNATGLEKMRETVDEKLHSTLQTRLTESFGQVTEQLNKVHTGLGEMTKLSDDVSDLSRIFTNVKSRGGFAEVFLDKLLDQVLAPGQYVHNAYVRQGTQDVVEYAVRFPGTSGQVLLPIDAKFPREDWERLESAYESGALDQIETARKAFDGAIRTEGKRISTKYINEPITTPYAIMFLPTESLYSEVLRRDGLQSELHQKYRVMVAGPTNLYALLTSFQLGFRMLNLQKKGDEVWKVLGAAQTEFGKFGVLMDKMAKQVGTVQNTIEDLGRRTKAINKTLSDVGETDKALPTSQLIDFDQAAGITTFGLAASGEDD